ncbi:hypothetical protein E8E13_007826 [Curvularia kusanoi]|uniref:Uncharacterized protein n=1 Tax=Curvularia kusanoi TaxID=90978 RepID=A0A9P4TCV0_CURKU|nr:hypothetical protein E8E13_007826 [Curvularia kusanoi]
MIIKWAILGGLFLIFMLWFIGGFIHAKRRLKAGKPLLGYHRFLVSYQDRKRYGQTPQNHFTFYATQNPYQQRPPYQQRQDGSWPEPPPMYNGTDAPPQYFAPPGATKMNPNQGGPGQGMEMPQYGMPPNGVPQGPQQSGVVGSGNANADVELGGQALPPRPPQKAKAVLKGFTERFRK